MSQIALRAGGAQVLEKWLHWLKNASQEQPRLARAVSVMDLPQLRIPREDSADEWESAPVVRPDTAVGLGVQVWLV
jgi:hypothetical protein